MTRPKAKFIGAGKPLGLVALRDPKGLRARLAALNPAKYTQEQVEEYRAFVAGYGDLDAARGAHPREAFVEQLVHASLVACTSLQRHRMRLAEGVSKQDLLVEVSVLLGSLSATSKMLRSMTSDVERLIPARLDPGALAESIDAFVTGTTAALAPVVIFSDGDDSTGVLDTDAPDRRSSLSQRVRNLRRAKRPAEVERLIADEMTRAVLDVLEDEGISTAASIDSASDRQSFVLQVLLELGKAAGLVRSARTWLQSIKRVKAPRKRGA